MGFRRVLGERELLVVLLERGAVMLIKWVKMSLPGTEFSTFVSGTWMEGRSDVDVSAREVSAHELVLILE